MFSSVVPHTWPIARIMHSHLAKIQKAKLYISCKQLHLVFRCHEQTVYVLYTFSDYACLARCTCWCNYKSNCSLVGKAKCTMEMLLTGLSNVPFSKLNWLLIFSCSSSPGYDSGSQLQGGILGANVSTPAFSLKAYDNYCSLTVLTDWSWRDRLFRTKEERNCFLYTIHLAERSMCFVIWL